MEFKGGPNRGNSQIKTGSWYDDRNVNTVLMKEFGKETSLLWMGIVNEFVHEINNLRKLLKLKVGEKIQVTVFQLSLEQHAALENEGTYIMEECQIHRLDLFQLHEKFFAHKGYNNHTIQLNDFLTNGTEVWGDITVDVVSTKN